MSKTQRATNRKPAPRGTASKATARTGAARKAGAPSVVEIRIRASGSRWSVALSNGVRMSVPAAAADACGVRVGVRWSNALEQRIERSVARQKLVTKAMRLLAKGGSPTRAALGKALGGDRDARLTVTELARLGWIS